MHQPVYGRGGAVIRQIPVILGRLGGFDPVLLLLALANNVLDLIMQRKYYNKESKERAEYYKAENIPAYFFHEGFKAVTNLIAAVADIFDEPLEGIQNGMIRFPFLLLANIFLQFSLFTRFFLPLCVCAVGKLFFLCQNIRESFTLLLPSAVEAGRRQCAAYINDRPRRDVLYLQERRAVRLLFK